MFGVISELIEAELLNSMLPSFANSNCTHQENKNFNQLTATKQKLALSGQ